MKSTFQIKGIKSRLTKTDEEILNYVEENSDSIIYMTISDVSQQTGTSDASIVRFCHKIGFSGFQDMKISLAKATADPYVLVNEKITSEDTPESIVQKTFSSIQDTLESTRKVLSMDQFVKAGNTLLHSNRIVVFGMGSSASVATDISHKFLRMGFRSEAYSDSHFQIIASCSLNVGDVAIGVSHSGNTRDVVEAMTLAKKNGATTICITNNSSSPITKNDVSDIRLFTASAETKYRVWGQTSRYAQLAIVDALYAYISFNKGKSVIDNIIEVDKSLSVKKY
ncbi:MAG: MurR/RpiR family transcriptional regulator [Eubacteriales bacterium]|nr:MurR/RpiR family transcriptional regulator [Eubacteriales bacterium]MDD4324041.1 MurR/RpiR family transcriptional regulator [Eubacteriales bacterium]